MVAGRHNIIIEHGSTFTLSATYADANGVPFNLTGFSAAMDVRDHDGSLVVDVGEDGTISLGGLAGTITVSIPLAVVNALAPGAYRYDLILTSGGGVGTKLLMGSAVVEPKVTAT